MSHKNGVSEMRFIVFEIYTSAFCYNSAFGQLTEDRTFALWDMSRRSNLGFHFCKIPKRSPPRKEDDLFVSGSHSDSADCLTFRIFVRKIEETKLRTREAPRLSSAIQTSHRRTSTTSSAPVPQQDQEPMDKHAWLHFEKVAVASEHIPGGQWIF